MGLLQQIKLEKEQMHPLRWKLIYVGLPLYFLLALGGACAMVLVDVFVLGAENGLGVLTFIGAGIFALATVLILVFSAKITQKEVLAEIEHFAYLMCDPKPITDEKVQATIDEFGVVYTLTKDGVSVEWEQKGGEQVFDEAKENEVFIAWTDAEIYLATQTLFRRAQLAVAVVVNGQPGAFIMPLNEKVYAALHTFGVMESATVEWSYLRYNPKDAFKQIITHGRIIRMHHRETGKVLTGDEEIQP